MNAAIFVLLVVAGSLGILLSLIQARSRAVFAEDGFREPGRRAVAMGLLAAVLLLTVAIPFAGGLVGTQPETKHLSLVSVFAVHAILLFFLACYFVLSGRRSLTDFLKLKSDRPAADLSAGVLIGVGGWILTIVAGLIIVGIWYLVSRRLPIEPGGGGTGVSPMIVWLVSRPLWVRIAIVLSAMVVEELFFRSFLQTRVGPIAATLMFTAAHGAYGQPLVLVGILVISTVLSMTFATYRNVLPCIIAHGVFDSIQMFVFIPMALREIPGF
ncbi:MAG TPA: CPBP family intramembrane glutamic endopeptidase [Thermoanaerobaculia bacterium]|jgi:membrane protease YdiL (CAAX protease family)